MSVCPRLRNVGLKPLRLSLVFLPHSQPSHPSSYLAYFSNSSFEHRLLPWYVLLLLERLKATNFPPTEVLTFASSFRLSNEQPRPLGFTPIEHTHNKLRSHHTQSHKMPAANGTNGVIPTNEGNFLFTVSLLRFRLGRAVNAAEGIKFREHRANLNVVGIRRRGSPR